MRLDDAKIRQLLSDHNMNQIQLALRIGITRGALSNVLSGRRTAGRKILAGLLRAFPGETLEDLTLPRQVAA
jgi:transcriptional regulator with XRE-family HTH domain